MYFIETSAKEADNVEKLFIEIAKELTQLVRSGHFDKDSKVGDLSPQDVSNVTLPPARETRSEFACCSRWLSSSTLRDSRDFSPYSSTAEYADEDKTSSSALSEDVEGSAVAGSPRFTDLKKEDMEEGPAVEPLAVDVEGPAIAGSGVTGTACLTGLKNE
ncbi:hypothetical protein E2C01_030363 [Portunus trituberculatus]|uniref:Uncharacterized protein n=1 Tax=Portunus trituberculatus TaxID=210409 RepID=A0A5B7ERV1_PORTR|nr:hypothetical protein [Portunus trituberculatus]